MTCVGDWIPFRCGDLVVERDSYDKHQRHGRHLGRVEAIFHGAFVRVRWLDNGWISDMRFTDLIKAKRDE